MLHISSTPVTIGDIPSLNKNKYLYINESNTEYNNISGVFFSDQTLLSYVEPFKNKNYINFFDLLANESVKYNYYEDYQNPRLNYLIDKNQIYVDQQGYIQFTNPSRTLILHDLFTNDVASFYRYASSFQQEALQMEKENIIYFGSTLFSKTEQDYYNFFLNKKEFTNGHDLRNKYLHGTQANPEETTKHENAYYIYLKLIILALLKMEDDLIIHNALEKIKSKQADQTK